MELLKVSRTRPNSKGLVFSMPMFYGFKTGALLFDESGNGFGGTAINSPVPKYPGFDFVSASSMYIDIGTGPTSVKTVAAWVKPDGVAGDDEVINLNVTDALLIATGTLTKAGFTGTTVLYVDGVAATTVTAAWHHIAITVTTAKNANDLDIGRSGSNYMDGLIADVRLYNRVLTAIEIKNLYELTRGRFGT